jgi:hypothetical protein
MSWRVFSTTVRKSPPMRIWRYVSSVAASMLTATEVRPASSSRSARSGVSSVPFRRQVHVRHARLPRKSDELLKLLMV